MKKGRERRQRKGEKEDGDWQRKKRKQGPEANDASLG